MTISRRSGSTGRGFDLDRDFPFAWIAPRLSTCFVLTWHNRH